jgi:homoserine kinase
MGDTLALVDALRARGLAATVSGAGPAVIVLADRDQSLDNVEGELFAGWKVLRPPVDLRGGFIIP